MRRSLPSFPTLVQPELLESRRVLAVTGVAPSPPVDLSPMPGTQIEPAVAIDRTNPLRLFVTANSGGSGILASLSEDGGVTWTPRVTADGTDGLPAACCDPAASFDAFGNLFVSYLSTVHSGTVKNAPQAVVLAVSTDGGQTFRKAGALAAPADRPTSDAFGGTVAVAFQQEDHIVLATAAVKAAGRVGRFRTRHIPAADSVNVADVAVGPDAQVALAYQTKSAAGGTSSIVVVRMAPAGRRQRLGEGSTVVTSTAVDGFDAIPAQPQRTIDASATLAFDRSAGPFQGRLYLAYGDEVPNESNDTDVLVRFSDDGGSTWSGSQRVNDDATAASQFFPRVAVDDASGTLAVGFYDCRDDDGSGTGGQRDAVANDEAHYYAAVGTPRGGGVSFAPNVRLSAAPSRAADADDPNEFGDYVGVDAFAGVMRAAWADNSGTPGGNPAGAHGEFDVAAAGAAYTLDADPTFGQAPTVHLRPTRTVRRGKTASITVEYLGASIDPASLRAPAVTVSGPNNYAQVATVRAVRKIKRPGGYAVRYAVSAPAGRWRVADNGAYAIALLGAAPRSSAGVPVADRPLLGQFVVDAPGG
jgi:hypothetical protein